MPQQPRIGLQIDRADPFWVQVREVILQKAHRFAAIVILVDLKSQVVLGPDEQVEIVEDVLSEDLGAIICATEQDDLLHSILDHGISIVHLSETRLRHPRLVSPRGLYAAAKTIAAYLAGRLAGNGTVLVVGGAAQLFGDTGRSRIAGIRNGLRPFPNIVVHQVACSWSYDDALDRVSAWLEANPPEIDAIFGLSDSLALAARDALAASGRRRERMLIAGVNGDPLALAAIAAGSMAATVEVDVEAIADKAIALALRAAEGRPLPRHFRYRQRLVTADNVAEVATRKLYSIATLPERLVGVNRQAERQRLAQLETSLAINEHVGTILDRGRLLQAITDLIRTHYAYDDVHLFLWDAKAHLLRRDESTGRESGPRSFSPDESGPLHFALLCNQLVFLPDARVSRRFPPDPTAPATRGRVVAPIRLGGEIIAVLDLRRRQPAHHTRQELEGLQLLADRLAVAMRNAELYGQAVQARTAAEKADQLKTRLLANVSHELRTPLNVILGYSRVALDSPGRHGPALPESLRQDLQHIYNSGEHLLRVVNDLLDLSRAEIDELELFPEALDTRPFLESLFHTFTDHLDGRGDVAWCLDLPEHLPIIEVDPVRLRQILLNLLHNARKFTRRGHVVLGAEVSPPHLHLWVEDTGSGIPIELQEQIFEPFVTAGLSPQPQAGIGLGLSIARRLVALHSGLITLESRVDRGSTFHVYLPLPTVSGRPVVALPATGERTLLLVSAQDRPPPSLVDLCRRCSLTLHRLHPNGDLNVLLATVRPAMLAWDMAEAAAGEWAIINQIRAHPQLCQIPVILYSQNRPDAPQPAGGMTTLLHKPLSGRSLLDAIERLRPPGIGGPILVVDDDPEARRLHRLLIAEHLPGYPVRTAGDGRAALELLEQETPSLVVLDLMMPDVDGFEVLDHLRSRPGTRQVPVLVLSGRVLSLDDIRRLSRSGVTFQSKEILTNAEMGESLRRTLAQNDALPPQTSLLVKQAIGLIQQCYPQDLSRQEIAETLGVHPDYLGRIFRQETGLSLWEYLTRYRIRQARQLLLQTDASITSVALQVGFRDVAYFSRIFHKEVGCSPRAYRERH